MECSQGSLISQYFNMKYLPWLEKALTFPLVLRAGRCLKGVCLMELEGCIHNPTAMGHPLPLKPPAGAWRTQQIPSSEFLLLGVTIIYKGRMVLERASYFCGGGWGSTTLPARQT